MVVVVININIISTVRLSDLSWILRSRNVTQTTATSTLATEPSVKARSASLAAPEISREISPSLSQKLGHHGTPGSKAGLPVTATHQVTSVHQKMQGYFSKGICSSLVSSGAAGLKRRASPDPIGEDKLSVSPKLAMISTPPILGCRSLSTS